MPSVVRARAQLLPDVTVSTREQDTAYGAARVAARLVSASPAATPTTP